MYAQFFNLRQAPFSIAPDPRYLLMTHGHREALAHLMYGIGGDGIVLLTGEIGAGKTTVCRCFLEQIPPNCNIAYIFNPKLTVNELLQSICDEFNIDVKGRVDGPATVKDYVDALTAHLLKAHAAGQNNLLIIDEAQNLSADVLEQLRLLTNLETNERKLLQIILIGQPELRTMLDQPELKQLAQRVIARYHLQALLEHEIADYIQHRLSVAGLLTATPFPPRLMKQIYQATQGVPRRINLLCNHALLGTYAEGRQQVDSRIVSKAAREVFGEERASKVKHWPYAVGSLVMSAVFAGAIAWSMNSSPETKTAVTKPDTTAAASGIRTAIVSEQDGRIQTGFKNEEEAYRELAKMWGTTLPEGEPCQVAPDHDLRCFKSGNGFADLRFLDRPAVLALSDNEDNIYPVLLTRLADNSATIRVGETTQTLSLVVLQRYFRGQFGTFWRAPHIHRENMAYGDRGQEVDWIATQLAKLNGEQAPEKDQRFDEKMAKQVREFQAAQGLKADGVVGPITFMHLNRAAGVEEPRLSGTLTAARPASIE